MGHESAGRRRNIHTPRQRTMERRTVCHANEKEWQNITLYKTNNTGKNLETEVNDFIAGKDPVKLEDYINVGNVSVPYLEKEEPCSIARIYSLPAGYGG